MRKSLVLLLIIGALLQSEAHGYSAQEFVRVMNPQEARIEQFRNAEIQQLQLVLSRSSAKEKEPELLLRLAELYTEKYRLYFLKENEIWSKQMEGYLAQPLARQKVTRKPVLDSSNSRQWLGRAIETLRQIPQQRGRFDRIDEVYYFLGFNLWEVNRKKEAAENFQKIVDDHPRSKFSSEAHRYLGDFHFANRDFRKSLQAYERAGRVGSSPARPRILYGMAWSQFKLQQYKQAVATMREAILEGRRNTDAAKVGLALQRDAAESLALFFSEGGSTEDAAAFFTDLFGEAEAGQVLRKLAENYQRQGKYAKALAINKQLLAMGGAAAQEGEEQRFEIMVDSLNIASQRKESTRQAALLKSLTAEFVTNSSAPRPERVEALRSQVRRAATIAHKEGNTSKNRKEAYERAEDLYRLYISAFGKHTKPEDIAEIRFYLTDVLSQMGKHREAAAEYKAIMDLAEADPIYKKYAKDSASGMVFSLDAYFKDRGDGKKMSRSDSDQLIAAIDSYVRAYPQDKDAPKYLARAAGVLVTNERMDEARPRLFALIEQYPGSKEAWDAAANLLKDAEDRKDFSGAERLATSFLGNRGLMAQDKKGEFRKKLESIGARAQFQQVRQVEQNQDFATAARGYEKLAQDSRDSEVRSKALNNAAISFQKAGDQVNELRIYERILESDPGNDMAAKNFLAVGNEHFLSGRYGEAAGTFERYYKIQSKRLGQLKGPEQKEVFEALRSAALLRRALKDNDQANANFREIVEAANKGVGIAKDAAGEFLFDMARRFRDEGNGPDAIRSFQRYSSAFPDGPHAVASSLETGLLYQKLREEEKAQNYFRTVISKVKASKKPSADELGAAARARLELLGALEEAFEKSPLRLPEQQLKADINAKLQALERLNKGYIEVMDFGDGTWGVEAFRRMALAYRTFGRKLERAPVPQEFSAEDKAKFSAQLKNVAAPVFVKMAETLETALQKGEQLQVVGPVMARTYLLSVLQSAKPDRMPLVQMISEEQWNRPGEWIMGDVPDSEGDLEARRKTLRTNPTDWASWIAIGNRHLARGETNLAEIFYLHVAQRNPKIVAAINNLAYLRGREGDGARAMAGFKAALGLDEFAVAPKKNMARLHMASGLWRHASLHYRQLEVRQPNDREVRRGIALSNLATGRFSQVDAAVVVQGEGTNGKFSEAILALSKGERSKAQALLGQISGQNEFAKLILDTWTSKEGS